MDLFNTITDVLTKEQKDKIQNLYDIRDNEYSIKLFPQKYILSKKERNILLYNMSTLYTFGIYRTEDYKVIDKRLKFDLNNKIHQKILLDDFNNIFESYNSIKEADRKNLLLHRNDTWTNQVINIFNQLFEYCNSWNLIYGLNNLSVEPEQLIKIHRNKLHFIINEITKFENF